MDLSMLAWAPYLVGGAVLPMVHPLGRRIAWRMMLSPWTAGAVKLSLILAGLYLFGVIIAALVLLGLLLASESGSGMD